MNIKELEKAINILFMPQVGPTVAGAQSTVALQAQQYCQTFID